MNIFWKSEQIGYEDVPLAVHNIVRSEKESRLTGWVVAVVLILANLIGLSVMVFVAQWMVPSANPVIVSIVATAAYVVGIVGMEIENLCRKISRMEMHALILHDELLCGKEKIEDVERVLQRGRNPNLD